MWWLDDGSFRGDRSNRRHVVYRRNVPVHRDRPRRAPAQKRRLHLNLTDAQKAANQALLESDTGREREVAALRRDIEALERALREQITHRDKLSERQAKESADHSQQIARMSDIYQSELQQLASCFRNHKLEANRKISAANKLLHAREVWLNEETRQARRLRAQLVTSERCAADRDREIAELQSTYETTCVHHANSIAELQHQHEAESKHLRAVADAAEARAAERGAEILRLREQLERERTDRQSQDSDKIRLLEEAVCDVRGQLREREHSNSELTTTLEVMESQFRQTRAENAQLRQRNDAILLEKVSAEEALRQSAKARNGEVDELARENELLQQRLNESLSENESITQTYHLLQCEQQSVIGDLRAKLTKAVEQTERLHEEAQQERVRTSELQSRWDSENVAEKERFSSLEKQLNESKATLEQERDNAASVTAAMQNEIENLKALLAKREAELSDLSNELGEKSEEVDRHYGALERLRAKNERLIEIHGSEFDSMRSRYDEMVTVLDTEKAKRMRAEEESRRLSSARAGRIAQMVRQNDMISQQVKLLREQNSRLATETAELRRRPERQDLERSEKQIQDLRDRLQKEAAERRKVEGILKRGANDSKGDTEGNSAWSRLEFEEQVRRLKNQIKSLHHSQLVERHRAAVAISKHQAVIAALQQNQSGQNRAA